MKIVVLSDIHANLDAFRAVLDAERGFDGFLSLGDLTGYGTEPAECVALARSVARKASWSLVLAGNHDAALTGKLAESWFNRAVLPSIAYSRARLSLNELDWLASLPAAADVILPGSVSSPGAPEGPARRNPLLAFFRKGTPVAIAAHGDPAEPLTGYLWGGEETAGAYDAMERRGVGLCFVGHSHEASAFSRGGFGTVSAAGILSIKDNAPVIVNPGSVGFPRDFGLLAKITEAASPSCEGGPVQEPLSLERYPAYYALWDTVSGTVSFRDARYDRTDFERRLSAAGI